MTPLTKNERILRFARLQMEGLVHVEQDSYRPDPPVTVTVKLNTSMPDDTMPGGWSYVDLMREFPSEVLLATLALTLDPERQKQASTRCKDWTVHAAIVLIAPMGHIAYAKEAMLMEAERAS